MAKSLMGNMTQVTMPLGSRDLSHPGFFLDGPPSSRVRNRQCKPKEAPTAGRPASERRPFTTAKELQSFKLLSDQSHTQSSSRPPCPCVFSCSPSAVLHRARPVPSTSSALLFLEFDSQGLDSGPLNLKISCLEEFPQISSSSSQMPPSRRGPCWPAHGKLSPCPPHVSLASPSPASPST